MEKIVVAQWSRTYLPSSRTPVRFLVASLRIAVVIISGNCGLRVAGFRVVVAITSGNCGALGVVATGNCGLLVAIANGNCGLLVVIVRLGLGLG